MCTACKSIKLAEKIFFLSYDNKQISIMYLRRFFYKCLAKNLGLRLGNGFYSPVFNLEYAQLSYSAQIVVGKV